MPLPASGPISLSDVNVELGLSVTAQISMNDAAVRGLFGRASGAISMSDGYGKSSEITVTFSTSTLNATVNMNSLPGYSAGETTVRIIVNSGVYLWSNSSTPALTLTGGVAGDKFAITNNGFIMGRGGNGGIAINATPFLVALATPGYDAISISRPVTIDNQNGYIGGGGGAGGNPMPTSNPSAAGGGGAGGGNGAYTVGVPSNPLPNTSQGGAIGQSGNTGVVPNTPDLAEFGASLAPSGGGGGRIMPGNATTGPTKIVSGFGGGSAGNGGQAGGSGGSGIFAFKGTNTAYVGGGGGGWGASGGNGSQSAGTSNNNLTATGGTGGGSGSAGGNGFYTPNPGVSNTQLGTAGGKAIRTNGNAVTWTGGAASSSRSFGAVS